MKSIVLQGLIVAVGLVVISMLQQWWSVPAAWKPWVPLTVDQRMTLVTRWKLENLEREPEQCLAVLAALPEDEIDYLPLEDYTPVEGCPLTNVIRLRHTGVGFNNRFTLSCPLAVAWVMFERQRLQPIARDILGTEVVQVDHFGSFACRNIYNRPDGRRSEHATASAFDVAGFHLADGRVTTVLDDWKSQAEPHKAEFLQAVHNAACDFFGTVLGPDYNDAHANHFHFDNAGFRFCR